MDWASSPIYDEYQEEVQETTYDEEPKDDLNEEYQDGDCGVESFDIQPTMTAQEDEKAYFMVVVGKDEEPTTYVPNDDRSLIKRFNGLSLDDDDDTFFVPIQKIVDFNEDNCSKVRFIALAIEHMGIKILSLEKKNQYVNFLGVDKYLFPDYKFDIDLVPSIENKAPCSEVIQVGSILTKIRPQQLCKDRNQVSVDHYVDLFFTLVTCDVWKNKSQINFFFQLGLL